MSRRLREQAQDLQGQLKAKLAELYVQVKSGQLTQEERTRLNEAIDAIKGKIERGTERRSRIDISKEHNATA